MCEVDDGGAKGGTNPSKEMGKREGADMEVEGGKEEEAKGALGGLNVGEVISCMAPDVRLVFVKQKFRSNRGQGETQSRCLRFSKGKYVGFMESDDERDNGNFSQIVGRLELKEGRLDAGESGQVVKR